MSMCFSGVGQLPQGLESAVPSQPVSMVMPPTSFYGQYQPSPQQQYPPQQRGPLPGPENMIYYQQPQV